jgi:hypothetical protein
MRKSGALASFLLVELPSSAACCLRDAFATSPYEWVIAAGVEGGACTCAHSFNSLSGRVFLREDGDTTLHPRMTHGVGAPFVSPLRRYFP